MKRVRIIVHGYVHGVLFRATTKQHAERLNITGWARNTSDGRVEIIAEGDEKALKELIAFYHNGPSRARVEKVTVSYSEPSREFSSFSITY